MHCESRKAQCADLSTGSVVRGGQNGEQLSGGKRCGPHAVHKDQPASGTKLRIATVVALAVQFNANGTNDTNDTNDTNGIGASYAQE